MNISKSGWGFFPQPVLFIGADVKLWNLNVDYFIKKDIILAHYILPILPCALLIYSLSKSRSRSIKAVKKKTEEDSFKLAIIPIWDILALPSLSAQNYSHVYIQHPNIHPYPPSTDLHIFLFVLASRSQMQTNLDISVVLEIISE